MTGQRYVIIEPDNGFRFTVLKEGLSKDEAVAELDRYHAMASGKVRLELAYLAMEGDAVVIDDTFLNSMDFDTLVDYTPIAVRRTPKALRRRMAV